MLRPSNWKPLSFFSQLSVATPFSISSGARKTVSYGIFACFMEAVSAPFSTLPASVPEKCSAPGSSFHCFQAKSVHEDRKRVFSVACNGISSASTSILPLGCVARQISPSAGDSLDAIGRSPSNPASSRLLARMRSSSLRLLFSPPTSCSGIQASVNAPLGQGLSSMVIRVSGIENCQPGSSRLMCAVRLSTESVCVRFSPSQLAPPFFSQTSPPETTPLLIVIHASRLKRAVCSATLSCIHLPSHGLTSMSSACSQTRPLFNRPSSSRRSIRTCIMPCCPVRLERLT